MKLRLVACLALVALNACSAPASLRGPVALNAQNAALRAQGAPASEEETTVGVLRHLYKESLADDVDNGRPAQPVALPRGGFIYERLNDFSLVRKAIYPLSDRIIKKEFNKPGKPDNVPPINAAALQQLQAQLQPGDIVLCGNNDSFVHGLIYLGNDEIIHSLAQLDGRGEFLGTIKETLTAYTQRVQRDKFVVLRKPGLTPADQQRISAFAHQQLGKSYDSLFLLSTEDRLYCTELVYQTLRQVSAPPRVFAHRAKYGWDLFTVEDIMDSPDLQTVWSYNYTRPAPGRLHAYR
ncbi:MAG: YiiX/YebB-like N1pC/P60 family cysteine hydrolase [Candidatus Sericytochromatia bacterium]